MAGMTTPQSAVGAGSGCAGFYQSPKSGSRNVSLRAEIDTSPPFGSVKEAVTHFESSGAWIHLHKLGLGDAFMNNIGEIDIKRVEEQTLELEKNLIVKELETLDVLEELGTTKRMVEDLKWQLQKEVLKCMAAANPEDPQLMMTPEITNKENQLYINQDKLVGNSTPCHMSSPDLILMELNQAKLNLGKTINELGSIQASVETLNKKIRKEKALLEKTRHRLTLKSTPEWKHPRNSPTPPQYSDKTEVSVFEDPAAADVPYQETPKIAMKTAEMKLVAAKKMEEAARAAEAVAIAEIKALSGNNEGSFDYLLPKRSIREAFLPIDGSNYFSRVAILRKLEEAAEEAKLSKQAMEEALQRMEIANGNQLAAGEALRRWNPQQDPRWHNPRPTRPAPLNYPLINESKPVLRTTVSMRDILSRKQQVLPDPSEEYHASTPRGQKVALSQMLNELREDIRFPSRSNNGNSNTQQKQFMAQRKKFGFIHISLPLARPNRKNQQSTDIR